MNLEDISVRIGEPLCGTWLNEASGLILEIEENTTNDYILAKTLSGEYHKTIIETSYIDELDAFTLDSTGLETLLAKEATGASIFYSQDKNRTILSRVSDNLLELSINGSAYVFVNDVYANTPLTEEDKKLLDEFSNELTLDDTDAAIGYNLDPNSIEGLPDWWSDADTADFFEQLAEEVKKEVESRLNIEEQIEEKVLERIIEKAAAKILAKKLAEREAKKVLERLLRQGKTRAQAERIMRRLAQKLEREYLYKHRRIWQRFNPLLKLKNLKKLLTSPKSWLRGKVAKFFIKGLGKRVLAIPGLIDDLLTIGEALYRWWQAREAWEGAREAWKQARELERELEKFRRSLTPEQLEQLKDLYRREKEFFDQLRDDHRKKAQQRACPDIPPITLVKPSITEQPQSQSITLGDRAYFTVVAQGNIASEPIHYTWFIRNQADGKTSQIGRDFASIEFIPAITDHEASLWVIATNNAGSITSNEVKLTVVEPVTSSLFPIISIPSGEIIKTTGNFGYRYSGYGVQLSSPDYLENNNISRLLLLEDGHPLGPAHASHADIRDNGQGRISHWKDRSKTYLNLSTSDNSDPKSNGRAYAVTVDSFESGSDLNPLITAQPQDQAIILGDQAFFIVTAQSNIEAGSLRYIWFMKRFGDAHASQIPGTSSSTELLPEIADNQTNFWVSVANDYGSTLSNKVTLTVYDLVWHQHNEWQTGTSNLMKGLGIGSGWQNFRTVFTTSDGVIYANLPNSHLWWYSHNGWIDGNINWSFKQVGSGWGFKFTLATNNGVIYGVADNGDLFWYKHEGWQDGSATWANNGTPTKVGSGWNFKSIFATSNGVIYGVADNGDLWWHKHEDWQDGSVAWANNGTPTKVGSGWNYKSIFATSNGVIYGVADNGDLFWYKHEGWQDGSATWANNGTPTKVGSDLNFKSIFATSNGIIYGIV